MRISRRSAGRVLGGAGAALVIAATGLPPAAASAASSPCTTRWNPVGPSFADCANGGTVLNILPPGENGLTTVAQFAGTQAGTTGPAAHSRDQLDEYANLIKAAPGLAPEQLRSYFKDARLGFGTSDAERYETPRPGTLIVRDTTAGVPHIFGADRFGTEFGAGYAAAEDRLFLMDLLRHVGRATVSSFLGPGPATLSLDCTTARVAGYSEAEFQQQFDRLATDHTRPFGNGLTDGQQVQADVQAYVAGVNQYIAEARTDPDKLPAEYPVLQEVPLDWRPTDVVAVATLVQSIFAVGGGGESQTTLLLGDLQGRYGTATGRAIWDDLRSQNDPAAPTTAPGTFNYPAATTVDPAAIAVPTGPTTTSFCNGGPAPAAGTGLGQVSVGPETFDLDALAAQARHASNAILVSGRVTASGHPIAVFGPQVGYKDPQLLHEEDLHGPGFNARGASFPGTDIYVELGRGADYAWSATSAGADIIDQFAERLCNVDGSPASLSSTAYVHDGQCVPMFERTDRQVAKTSAGAQSPPSVVTIQVERTLHGPVVGRTTAIDPASGQAIPVAIAQDRSTFFDELGSAPAFMEWNDPDHIHSAVDFQRAAGLETGTFNWFYVDSRDIAYYMSGQLPVRAPGADTSLLTWGTGQWDWRGFVPTDLSRADLHPRTINPASGFITSWNNKQAPGFSAADNNFAYGPVYRVQSLNQRIAPLVRRGSIQPVEVVNAMADAATVDLDGSQVAAPIAAVLAHASLTPAQSRALSILQAWAAHGAHRRADPSDPSRYAEGNAVALMDALYPRVAHAVFDAWLNDRQFGELSGILGMNQPANSSGSAYDGGWEGYLQRALQQALNPSLPARYSQSYCGGGSLAVCAGLLQGALQSALDAEAQAYGTADPTAWTCSRSNSGAQCNPSGEDIVFSAAGVATVPSIPWQNRPTFQQVVQYVNHR